MSLLIHGATVVTSLSPPVVARLDIQVDSGRTVMSAVVVTAEPLTK